MNYCGCELFSPIVPLSTIEICNNLEKLVFFRLSIFVCVEIFFMALQVFSEVFCNGSINLNNEVV